MGFTQFSCTALALSCVLVSSCSLRKNGSCDSSTEAVTAPLQKIIASDNAKDLNAVLSHYTEDVTWLPPAGILLQGKSAIRARYETLFSTFKST
jgi:ketosteroid isomerase-like protein